MIVVWESYFDIHTDNIWQNMIKELEVLCNECRSNSCIEHALGIIEEKRTQENISQGISDISLTGAERVHNSLLFMWFPFFSGHALSYGSFGFWLGWNCHISWDNNSICNCMKIYWYIFWHVSIGFSWRSSYLRNLMFMIRLWVIQMWNVHLALHPFPQLSRQFPVILSCWIWLMIRSNSHLLKIGWRRIEKQRVAL